MEEYATNVIAAGLTVYGLGMGVQGISPKISVTNTMQPIINANGTMQLATASAPTISVAVEGGLLGKLAYSAVGSLGGSFYNGSKGAENTQPDSKNDKKHNTDQEALNKLGKEAENAAKKGNPISEEEAKILDEWADEYNVDQHHKAYDGSGEHMKGGQDHTHIYNHHIPYIK